MENKSHAIAAGIFVLVVLGLLAGLAAWLGRDQASYDSYELTTPQAVTGLQPQAAVRYKGVTVGKVVSIGFDPEAAGSVLIHIDIDRTAPLTLKTYATLGYQGITGLAHIDLDDATENQPDLGMSPGGHRRLVMRPSNLSLVAAQGPELMGDIREMMVRANSLLSEHNQRMLVEAISNLGEAARSTASLAQEMERGWSQRLEPAMLQLAREGSTNMQAMRGAALSLETMSQEIARSVHRINMPDGAIDQLTASARTLASIGSEIDGATLPRMARTLDDIGGTARDIGALARGISSNPQALIYGPDTTQPGPGEPGYAPPVLRASPK
ncbi:TPA: MCE family protein [Pseudomonas aeruginosa]|uniref:MlaD family protein n=1 Tax=Pseudomonas aeruginosa TaxID=287 RepID=UPI0003B9669A|nr:MlaD family protein [Pseudomonas aeruginosa]ERY35689.1 hypothetical protein Q067_02324 [Pseudomonas aeruginosa BL13]MBH4028540.1 MCE family protein [Pseudomonas aeruginosa]MBV5530490.1 MCE family protein [Pseudomonas aeruginosa]MCS8095466.1 MlaD family protein [Pseudomonas aeruginosa]RTS98558.1 MCE family protein [Pseudomonas aeruginosa]